MKVIPIALQTKRESGTTTEAGGLFLLRRDGQAFGFTSTGADSVIDLSAWWDDPAAEAFVLDAAQGLDITNFVTTSGLDVSNGEVQHILYTEDDGSFFDRTEVLQGIWRGCQYWAFKYDYTAEALTTTDVEVVSCGRIGESGLNLTTIVLELRDITQMLQQSIGMATQPTCRSRLGDALCTVDLEPWTHDLTVTEVDPTKPRLRFKCAGATQEADYFGNGTATFTAGDNDKVDSLVTAFEDGWFTLALSLLENVQVGDTLTAVAGCRKRHTMTLNEDGQTWTLVVSDCKTKFDNVPNFQGEPHVPPLDQLTSPASPDA